MDEELYDLYSNLINGVKDKDKKQQVRYLLYSLTFEDEEFGPMHVCSVSDLVKVTLKEFESLGLSSGIVSKLNSYIKKNYGREFEVGNKEFCKTKRINYSLIKTKKIEYSL